MEKDVKKMHEAAIKKQLDAAGFPAELIDEFLRDFSPGSGKRLSWSFETQINQMKVKGKLHAEPNAPSGLYALDYYQLDLGKLKNKFLCSPWSWIRLDEAVNLMQGRYVYRKPDSDPTGEGYWMYLTEEELLDGVRRLGFIRIPFDVGNFLAGTGLGSWMGLTGWVQLVEGLERGGRCDLVIGSGAGMTAIKLEADPREKRLKLFDIKGKELQLEKFLKRKYHGNVE